MYRYNPYTSVYRDPQSVKVNELLRQRFQNAFNADDLIATAAQDMTAADFEGDQIAKERLQNETREELRARAERGDYETMMMDVSRSARKFQDKYKPIKENYDRFEAYKATLKKAFDDGTITGPTKQRLLALSQYGYNGLQYDENGEVDEDSYFNGEGFVKDINIQERLAERIKKFSPSGDIRERNYLGQPGVMVDPGTGQQIEVPMFEIKTKGGWEGVSPDRVKAIFNNMMQEPEVVASINQQVRLSTFDVNDTALQNQLYKTLNDPGGIYDAIEEAKKEKDSKKAGELQAQAKQLEKLLSGTGQETPEQLAAIRKDYVNGRIRDEIIDRERNAAIAQYSWAKTTGSELVGYDPLFLRGLNEESSRSLPDPMVGNSAVEEYFAPGGETVDSVVTEASTITNNQEERLNKYNSTYKTNYTLDQVLSNSVIDDSDDFKLLKSEIDQLEIERDLLTARLYGAALATNHLFSWEEEVKDYINKEFEPEKYNSRGSINKLGFIRAVNEALGTNFNTFADAVEKGVDLNERAHMGGAGLDLDAQKRYATFVETYEKETGKNIDSKDMFLWERTYDDAVTKIKNKWNSDMNSHLETNNKVQTSGKVSQYLPGYFTEKDMKKNTETVLDFFMGTNSVGVKPEDLLYFTNEDGIYQKGTLSDLADVPPSKWTVTNVTFPYNATGQTNGVNLVLEGDYGANSTIERRVFYPIENASNLALVQSFERPPFKLSSLIHTVKGAVPGIKGFSVEFVDKEGQTRKRARIYEGYGGYKVDIEGMGSGFSLSDPALLAGVEDVMNIDGYSLRLDADSFQDPKNYSKK